MSKWRWNTTMSNPWARVGYGNPCAGVTGWKLHIVDLENIELVRYHGHDVIKKPALCGLVPAHGWGVDLFIDEECARCTAKAEKLGLDLDKDIK